MITCNVDFVNNIVKTYANVCSKNTKNAANQAILLWKASCKRVFRLSLTRSGTSLRHVLKRVQIVAKSVGNHFYKIVYVRNAFVFFHNVPVVK